MIAAEIAFAAEQHGAADSAYRKALDIFGSNMDTGSLAQARAEYANFLKRIRRPDR